MLAMRLEAFGEAQPTTTLVQTRLWTRQDASKKLSSRRGSTKMGDGQATHRIDFLRGDFRGEQILSNVEA